MSKAEERAFETYPFIDGEMSKTQNANAGRMYARNIFKKGYHQAEEDLKLTWEDIRRICLIAREVHQFMGFWSDTVYQEVLERFNDYKQGK